MLLGASREEKGAKELESREGLREYLWGVLKCYDLLPYGKQEGTEEEKGAAWVVFLDVWQAAPEIESHRFQVSGVSPSNMSGF